MSIKDVSKPFLIVATASLAASGLGVYAWQQQSRSPVLEVYVFALKSGRSMFIRTPDDQRILVDGGGNSQVIKYLTDIIPFYSRRINTIIITNTDDKNSSGLIDVVDRYLVDRVYVPKFTLENVGVSSSTDKIYKTFIETVEQKDILVEEVSVGDEILLGNGLSNSSSNSSLNYVKNVLAQILFPVVPEVFDYSKASAPEILFNISYGDTSLSFIGDASKKVQKFVASTSPTVFSALSKSDVLIVSHSAEPANISQELMDVVRPRSLIYEKTVTGKSSSKTKNNSKSSSNGNSKTVKSNKKIVGNPLAMILEDDRYNLKEIGTVKIVSDGVTVKVSSW